MTEAYWKFKRFAGTTIILLLALFVIASRQTVPGARYSSISWIDSVGALWLFGGQGYDSSGIGALNDLWQFNPSTSQWTWISGSNTINQPGVYGTQGTPSSLNVPGNRHSSISWIDSTGALWLFGGNGFASGGLLNDLWQFNPSTNQWTWISGSNTVSQHGIYGAQGTASSSGIPGSRQISISWIDSNGTLWLFGGQGYDSSGIGLLNDLWQFNPSTNQWTWISGNNTINQPGVYGTQGTSSSLNIPGARYSSISWIDSNGALWLFGGQSYDSGGLLNDLWQFNPSTNQWTWISGNNTINQRGVYGTQGTPSSLNIPGARYFSISWIDSVGALWLFGGNGFALGGIGALNDLWQFNPSTNQWTWISGNNTINQPGVYGTQGTPSSLNIPGARYSSISWIDSTGALWLFGGNGYALGGNGALNDLWQFNPSTNQWTWISGNNTINQRGVYGTQGIVPITAPAFVPVTQPAVPLAPTTQPTDPQADVPSANNSQVIPVESPSSLDAQVIVPAIVVPVVVIGALVGILVGLRKKLVQKDKKQLNPLPLLPFGDSRLVPYDSVILENEIGAGSYGKVFLGKWRATKVAIKVGNAAISTEEFLKEADFQMKIPPHPNIVQLLGVSTDGPQPLVLLEYCNEGSVDNILFDTNESISATVQLKIANGIARGLYHLHENNIVHRDLAARNILLNSGEAKISDFGLSRKIKEEAKVGKTASNVGPLRWMAPESLASQTYSKKSDVWTFGIVLYEITARQEPHIEEDILGIAVKIRDSAYTPRIVNDCPSLLREIMEMCWQRDPEQRPSMEQICEKFDK